MLLLALPQMALGMLSKSAWVTSLTGTYYWILCEAVIIMACIGSAQRDPARAGRSIPRPLFFLATSTTIFSLLFSPLPHGLGSTWANYALLYERTSLERITARIPTDASLCVQNNLGPHLSQRQKVVAFWRECQPSDYALFHLRWVGGPNSGLFARAWSNILLGQPVGIVVREVSRMMSSPNWGLLAQQDGFYLFARNQPSRISREAMMAEFARDLTIFDGQLREAEEHRWKVARRLISATGWKDLTR